MMEDYEREAGSDEYGLRVCREIVDNANSIILRWDTGLRVTFVNDFAQQFFGFGPEEIVGKSLIGTIVAPESAAGRNLKAMIEDIVSHPERYVNNENENVRRDGSRVWISWTNRALRDREGRVVEILSVGNDITDRKRAEEALERQLRLTQTLLDAIPLPVFYEDARGVYTGCNRAFAEFMGRPKEEIVGRTVFDLAPPDLAKTYREADEALFRRPGTQEYESVVADAGGVRHDAVFYKATFLNKDGSVGGLIGTMIDITDRKAMWQELVEARKELEKRVLERTQELERANEFLRREAVEHRRDETALRESEEEFRSLAEAASAAIFFHQGGDYIYVNPAAEEITGHTKEELLGMKFWEIFAPEYREMLRQRSLARLRGEQQPARYVTKIVKADGSERWLDVSAKLTEFRGKPSVLITALDVTQRREAEEGLKKAKARAELYLDLMGHDISNMNQAMMGYLEMAQDLLDLEGHEELIERPLEIIRHSSRLISNVKKLEQAQSGRLPLKPVDLCRTLGDVAAAYARVPGRDVKILYCPAPGCIVQANGLLRDLFDNLVENAIRHSEGPLKIEVRVDPVAEQGGKGYMISVADTGPGIPDDLKNRIFTDLQESPGGPARRGLGLFMVRTLVEMYHGRVWVEDRVPGDYHQGARFVVVLPAAQDAT